MNKLNFKTTILTLSVLILTCPVFSFAVELAAPGASSASTSSDAFAPTTFGINSGAGAQNNNSSSFGINTYSTQSDTLGNNTVNTDNDNNPTVQSASRSGFSLVVSCIGGDTKCGWNDLVLLAKRLMVYMIFIGTTLAAISVAYAGFMYATSAGNSGKIEKAHHIFTSVAIGVLFLWGGWLLVATIMSTFGVKNFFSLVDSGSVQPVTSTKNK